MTFHVGQKVVCVDDGNMDLRSDERGPKRGLIYTIRGWRTRESVFLVEIKNPSKNYTDHPECGFYAWRFRPLTERKNDGEAFVEKLKKNCTPNDFEKIREPSLCGND